MLKPINCDLGEGFFAVDNEVMPLIQMANIACGGHSGDDESMTRCVKLAKKHEVQIGAHPSYADKDNFGRISQKIPEANLFKMLLGQVTNLKKICEVEGVKMTHIKPHGALYHDMMRGEATFSVIVKLLQDIDSELLLLVRADADEAKFKGLKIAREAFADRRYKNTKMLDRSEPSAVFDDPNKIVKQYHNLQNNPPFELDTICFHGDNIASVQALKILNARNN